MSLNSTFARDDRSSPSITEEDLGSSDNFVTFRKRLDGGINQKEFQETVLSILSDIQAKQDQQLKTITTELNKIKSQNDKIQETQKGLEEAVRFVTDQYEDMREKIGYLEEKIKDNAKMKTSQQEHSGHIYELQTHLEDLNRKLREKRVEIRNIPHNNDEDQIKIVENIYTSLDLKFDKAIITDVHRVSTKSKENKPLIIELNTIKSKVELLGGLKKYNKMNRGNPLGTNKLGFPGKDSPIYAMDHLTPFAAKIYFLARELKRQNNYKYCWSNLGRIYVKKNDDSPAILLRNEVQIEGLKAQK